MRSTTTLTDIAAGEAAADRPLADVRGFWRVGLALIAPVPMLAKGIEYLFNPVDGGAPFLETVAAYQHQYELVSVLRWLDLAFGICLVPATAALIWAARRGAPRLTTIGALLTLPGFLTALYLFSGGSPAWPTVRYGLDANAMAQMLTALESDPAHQVAGLLFIVGIVVGLPVLGAALWRIRAVPGWMALALIVGAGTHPFVPGHLVQGVGLLVAAIGFAGATGALLQLSDTEFDLPAVSRTGA